MTTEVCDPLSTAAGLHKVGGMYYSIAGLPPKFASTLQNIVLAQFIFTQDQHDLKNAKCFRKVIEECKFLFQNGITINVDGSTYQVYFVVLSVLGDNLGVNSLLGFQESFSATYYCRFCFTTKYNASQLYEEDATLLRNVENYEEDVKTFSRGVKAKCIFNELPFFHNTLDVSCDVMHDLFLGVCRYIMATVIKHCKKTNILH